MFFRDVQHQPRAITLLRRSLASGRLPHAYLLEGPEGVGKELAGRALAARLLCEADRIAVDADACGACRSCKLLAADNHPDFHFIHRGLHKLHPDRSIRESKGLYLVVDVVRYFLIEPATRTPSLGRRRVFLIRDAERMNEEAQNALLKTLEEPPGAACLLLVTASGDRLLPTIRSRCQRVTFDLLPHAFVQERLTATGVEQAAARTLAGLSQGRLGAALRWHQARLLDALDEVSDVLCEGLPASPEEFAKRLIESAESLAERGAGATEGPEAAESQSAGAAAAAPGADVDADDEPRGRRSRKSSSDSPATDELRDALKLVLLLIATIYRDALLAQTAGGSLLLLPREHRAVHELARDADADALAEAIQAVSRVEWMLDRNVAPQLGCEHLAVALCGGVRV